MDSVARIESCLDYLFLGAPARLFYTAHFCSGLWVQLYLIRLGGRQSTMQNFDGSDAKFRASGSVRTLRN